MVGIRIGSGISNSLDRYGFGFNKIPGSRSGFNESGSETLVMEVVEPKAIEFFPYQAADSHSAKSLDPIADPDP